MMNDVIQDLLYDVAELKRKIGNIVRQGTVTKVDHEKARVKVESGGMITDWIPWLTARAGNDRNWHPPEEKEQVVLLSATGAADQYVAIPALYQEAFKPPSTDEHVSVTQYQDGAMVSYDRKAHKMKINLPDEKAEIRIIAKGNIHVEGDVIADGISLIHHTHPQNGGDHYGGGTNTGKPS